MMPATGPAAPSVSVLMVAHNAGAFLAPAVASVLRQTPDSLELVLVDNASTDGSMPSLGELAGDSRLRVLTLPQNMGQVGGWRVGLDVCRGEWLAFMDADDISLPGRLAAQVAFLRERPEIDLVVTLADEITAAGERLGPGFSVTDEAAIRAFAEFDMPVRLNTAMTRTAFARRVGVTAEDSWAGDYQFLLDALACGRLAGLPEVHYLHRVHGGSMTATGRERQVLAAALVSFRAARRRQGGQSGLRLNSAERAALEAGEVRAVHRFFMRQARAAKLPALAVFHARRARDVVGIFRALKLAASIEPVRFGFLCRLALGGPLHALGIRRPVTLQSDTVPSDSAAPASISRQ